MAEYRDILGYEGIYQVTATGRVKTLSRRATGKNGTVVTIHESIKKMKLNSSNQYTVQLVNKEGTKKRARVAVLVASAFLGEPLPGHRVIYIDRNSQNYRLENLRYAVPDVKNRPRKTTTTRRLAEEDVKNILGLRLAQTSLQTISDKYGISIMTVSNIINCKTWRPVVKAWRRRNKDWQSMIGFHCEIGKPRVLSPIKKLTARLTEQVKSTNLKSKSIKRPIPGFGDLYFINTIGTITRVDQLGNVKIKYRQDGIHPDKFVVLHRADGTKEYPTVISLLEKTFGDLLI